MQKKNFYDWKFTKDALKYPQTSVGPGLAHNFGITNQIELLSDIGRRGQWRNLDSLAGLLLHNNALLLCDCLPQLTAGRIPATGGFC